MSSVPATHLSPIPNLRHPVARRLGAGPTVAGENMRIPLGWKLRGVDDVVRAGLVETLEA